MNLKYDGTDILNMSTVTGNNSETMIVYHSDFTVTSETKITRSNIGTDNFYISQIYGIKFGSGGGLSEIPIATNETLGGIKVGNYLNITDEGILSAAVDKELSAESNNPIEASAVYNAVNNLIVLDEEEF